MVTLNVKCHDAHFCQRHGNFAQVVAHAAAHTSSYQGMLQKKHPTLKKKVRIYSALLVCTDILHLK
jgi:hypothetical protein